MSEENNSRGEDAIIDEIHDALHHEIEATNGRDFSGEFGVRVRIDKGKIQAVSICRKTRVRFNQPENGEGKNDHV